MLNGQIFYHGTIRKSIVAFGRLFSDIYIDRKQGDSVNGTTSQRLQIPLAYAPKEKWLVRLDSDPTLQNNTMTSLPRMSFEILDYTYDSNRKTNRMQQIKGPTVNNSAPSVYTPVPYNIGISLYILTKTQEDGLQILEQILPTFTPEYTLTINTVPELGVKNDVPIILNSVTVQDEYDGSFQERRFVTHTLSFTMKVNLFGAVDPQKLITQVNANVGNKEDFSNPNRVYTASGDAITATVSNEDWLSNF
jgi:hypothetical protein